MTKKGEDPYYERFSDWMEDRVMGARFSSITTIPEFMKKLEDIRVECYRTKTGRIIFKRYFGAQTTKKVEESDLDMVRDSRAEEQWRALVEREGAAVEEKAAEGYKEELRKIVDADDIVKVAEDIIKRDDFKKTTSKKKMMDFVKEQPAWDALSDYEKKRIELKQVLVDYNDIQQAEGAYAGRRSTELKRLLTEKRNEITRTYPELKQSPALATIGEKVTSIGRPQEHYTERRSDFADEKAWKAWQARYRRNIWPKLKGDVAKKYGFEGMRDTKKTEKVFNEYKTLYGQIEQQLPDYKKAQLRRVYGPEVVKNIATVPELEALKDRLKGRI